MTSKGLLAYPIEHKIIVFTAILYHRCRQANKQCQLAISRNNRDLILGIGPFYVFGIIVLRYSQDFTSYFFFKITYPLVSCLNIGNL